MLFFKHASLLIVFLALLACTDNDETKVNPTTNNETAKVPKPKHTIQDFFSQCKDGICSKPLVHGFVRSKESYEYHSASYLSVFYLDDKWSIPYFTIEATSETIKKLKPARNQRIEFLGTMSKSYTSTKIEDVKFLRTIPFDEYEKKCQRERIYRDARHWDKEWFKGLNGYVMPAYGNDVKPTKVTLIPTLKQTGPNSYDTSKVTIREKTAVLVMDTPAKGGSVGSRGFILKVKEIGSAKEHLIEASYFYETDYWNCKPLEAIKYGPVRLNFNAKIDRPVDRHGKWIEKLDGDIAICDGKYNGYSKEYDFKISCRFPHNSITVEGRIALKALSRPKTTVQ